MFTTFFTTHYSITMKTISILYNTRLFNVNWFKVRYIVVNFNYKSLFTNIANEICLRYTRARICMLTLWICSKPFENCIQIPMTQSIPNYKIKYILNEYIHTILNVFIVTNLNKTYHIFLKNNDSKLHVFI